MMKRSLVLKKETLTDLSASELSLVAGAGDPQPTPPQPAPQIPTWEACPLTGPYPTLPIRDCIREG